MKLKHALWLLPILASACKKQPVNEAASFTYTFSNPHKVRMNVDVYKSREDYYNNKGALKLFIPPGSSTTISVPYLNTGQQYWVDWYNNDYTYTNWGMDNNLYVLNGDTYTINNDPDTVSKYTGVVRVVWLGKDKASTTWKAVDAYRVNSNGYYEPAWALLTDAMKKKGLTVNKDLSCVYYEYRNADSIHTQANYRAVNRGNSSRIQIYNNNKMLAESFNYRSSDDTIAIRFMTDSTTWYKMVR